MPVSVIATRLYRLFSTLDLIDTLVATDAKMVEERLEYRTLLRQAGYIFVPVSEDELTHHLKASTVVDDEVVETVGLKAIRENVLQVRMSTWLQIPEEEYWLVELQKTFVQVLKTSGKPMLTFRLHRHAPTGSWIKLTSKAGRIAMATR